MGKAFVISMGYVLCAGFAWGVIAAALHVPWWAAFLVGMLVGGGAQIFGLHRHWPAHD